MFFGFYVCSCFILHVFILKVPVYLSWYRWSSAALLSIIPKHSSVDSQHYVSAICKWWLIIYHSIHQSRKLVVFSRPLPLPRTMGPFPVGCVAEKGEKQASIVKQGHYISVSGPWNERRIERTVKFSPLTWRLTGARSNTTENILKSCLEVCWTL